MEPLKPIVWFVRDYATRHRRPWNRALHLVGVPLAPFLCLYFLVVARFELAATSFGAGYALQWLGHRIEGNDVGEWTLLKHLAARVAGSARRHRDDVAPPASRATGDGR